MILHNTIAHYRITGKLGAGGMGEVYRATDTKLARDVALKVIPENFVQDAARMSRFRREAQVLASLNHPNIAAIYGVEERALVMELVEGATLAERIAAGPIPLDEALPIAMQIADALEYAHEHRVIHRDLKPANIKITPDDRVKVLDFGLAKALSGEAANVGNPETSPTITLQTATSGFIIGTAGYMSPEQARGKAVDKRADIWAFGVVLVEMLIGQPLFQGETVSDTLAAVLRSEVDCSRLPPQTPLGVRKLIERCLQRDPARRLRDIGDAGILIDTAPTTEPIATTIKSRKKWLPWAAAALLTGAAVAASLVWFSFRPTASSESVRFDISPPQGAGLMYPVVSPDGRRIVFTDIGSHESLYVRRLDRLEAVPVPGSDGANSRPFWSADSRRLGFFVGGKLNTVAVGGGDLETLVDGLIGNGRAYSGAWSSAGVILFTQAGKPIYKIPDTGGTATPVLSFDESRGETAQLLCCFLPDGKHFLYVSRGRTGVDTYEASLDGSKPVRVLRSGAALGFSRSENGPTGYLLYYTDGQILLRDLDLFGSRVPSNITLVRSAPTNCLLCSSPAATFVATNEAGSIGGGTLAYVEDASSRQISWVSREGGTVEQLANRPASMDVRISPDQQHLVFSRGDAIWLANAHREGATRLTFNEDTASTPVFSPDGNRIAYTSEQSTIVIRAANGIGTPETVFKTTVEVHPAGWSPNGEWLACIIGEPLHWDIDLLPISPGRKPIPLVSDANTSLEAYQPQFSPDGRWIAYTSNESGSYQTFIVNVPRAAGGSAVPGAWQISTAGGQQPRWRADGKELFFLSPEGEMMSVEINSSANGLKASTPEPLFATGIIPAGPAYRYDVTANGRQFVLLKTAGTRTPPLKVIVNWGSAFALR